MSRRTAAELALLSNTLVWGATFVIVKSALADISPILFLALRFTLATSAVLLLFPGFGRGGFAWREYVAGALAGVFLFGGYLFQTVGLRYTTAPKSAFITGLTSVMVPLLAALVYRVRPRISEVAGVMVATVGLGLMTLEGTIGSIGRGDLLTLFCAVSFAAHIVTLGHFAERMRFEVLSVMQVATAAVLSLGLFRWAETPYLQWRPVVGYAILVTGLLATAGAFSIQAWAQRYTTATRTALIYMLEPVIAWLTSYWLAGEGLSARAAAGAALILSGVLLVEMKPLNPRLHPSK